MHNACDCSGVSPCKEHGCTTSYTVKWFVNWRVPLLHATSDWADCQEGTRSLARAGFSSGHSPSYTGARVALLGRFAANYWTNVIGSRHSFPRLWCSMVAGDTNHFICSHLDSCTYSHISYSRKATNEDLETLHFRWHTHEWVARVFLLCSNNCVCHIHEHMNNSADDIPLLLGQGCIHHSTSPL